MSRKPAERMRRLLFEQTALLTEVVKWTVYASAVGVVVGASTAAFLGVLGWSTAAVEGLPGHLFLLPIGFLSSYLLVRWLAPEAEGHGTEKVIEAVHTRWGRIPLLVAPVKTVATVLTLAVGGSVGKEGPAAQIGAALASALAGILRLGPRDRRRVVICGIGAGFAAVFGTPIAGAVFGLEVLVLGTVLYDALYPSLVAGIVSHQVATRLGLVYFHQHLYAIPRTTEGILVMTIAAGIVFGLIALLLIETTRMAHGVVSRIRCPRWLIPAGGGLSLLVLSWVASERYLGLGVPTIEASVRGAWVPSAAFLLKIVFTALSLGTGGSGGIVTPIFFVGATAGNTLGALLGFDRGTFAAIGMVSLLSGAANAPLAASIMSIELFGPEVAPFAAISSIVAFVMVGHRSVYPSQLIGITKAGGVRVRRGVAVRHERVEVLTPRFRRTRLLWRALARLGRRRAE